MKKIFLLMLFLCFQITRAQTVLDPHDKPPCQIDTVYLVAKSNFIEVNFRTKTHTTGDEKLILSLVSMDENQIVRKYVNINSTFEVPVTSLKNHTFVIRGGKPSGEYKLKIISDAWADYETVVCLQNKTP